MATDYPKKGDDKKISLRNSNFERFDYDYAVKLKNDHPKIWKAGGNIRGNSAFKLYGRAINGDDAKSVLDWIKEREAWASRHFENGNQFNDDANINITNVAGIVAQIKWGVVGILGQKKMKKIINELMDKLELKDMEKSELNLEKRHIQKIEETDESIIIYYGKSESDVEMDDQQDEENPMDENPTEEPIDENPSVEDSNDDDDDYKKRSLEVEKRNFTLESIEVRSDENGKNRVEGYGSVFNKLSEDLGGFREMIMPGAFDSVLDNDVRLLFNHDQNYVLGRTTSGTLRLSVDENGLRYDAELPDTTFAKDLIKLMERGDINQSSFSFVIEEDSWGKMENGYPLRKIEKVKRLFDTAIVTYPAYPDAGVGLRSLEQFKMDEGIKKDVKDRKSEEIDLHRRSIASYKLKMAKLK